MSNVLKENRVGLIKTAAILTAVSTVLSLSGVLSLTAFAVVPSDYGLKEGWTISAAGSDDPDVYIVNDWGYKRLFLNPQIFNLYGHLGGFAAVKNVSPATRDAFGTSGLFRVDGTEKVYGIESISEDVAVLHWVNTSGAQAVADDANFFKKVFIINSAEFNLYQLGSNYTSVNQVPNYTRVPGATPYPTGPLSAVLASDNPVAGTIMETQSMADLAHFQINGSGAVTNFELKRLGVSGDTTISDVYLFVNGARVSDSGNVSSGVITFANGSGLFTAPANVSVRAFVADSTSGQTVGVQLTKVNTTVVSATGNVHNIAANPATLATVSIGASTGPGDFNPQNDVNVWQSNLTISNEDVYFKRFTIREIGSVDAKDIKNLRLFVDGVQVASDMDLDVDGYANFLMNYRMLTGTRVVKVMADVIGGSTRTMQFSFRGFYDIDVMDESYNVNVKATAGVSFPEDPTASTIGTPSVTAIKSANSPSGDLVDDASDVVLGRFDLTAFGDSVKIETLSFRASVSAAAIDSLRNGRVLINGVQYGSTTTLATTGDLTDASTSFTVNYTLVPGAAAVVEVRADLHEASGDTDSVTAEDIISVNMEGGDNNNAQGVVSATTLDVPSSSIESNNQTVKSGSMSVAKYTTYANQTVVVPNSLMLLGKFVLVGGSAEDVNINTVNVGFDIADQWDDSNLSNVYVKVLNTSGGLVLQSSPKSSVTGDATGSVDNGYSMSFTLPKSTTYYAEVWGSVSSFTAASSDDQLIVNMDTSGTSAQSGATVTGTQATGQTLTAATGSIAESASGAAPADKMVLANSTATVHAVDFAATSDDFTIYEMVLEMENGANAAATVANVIIKYGGVAVANGSLPLSGASASFTGLNILVPKDTTKTLTFDLQFGNVGVGAASSAMDATLNMESYKARDTVGNITTDTTERQSNNIYVRKAYPSVAAMTLPTSSLVGGEQTLSKFSLTANGGTIALASLSWDIAKDTATKIASTSTSAKLFVDGNDVSSLGTWVHTTADGTWTTGKISFLFTSDYDVPAGTAKTFELKDSITGTITDKIVVTELKLGNDTFMAPNTSALAGVGSKLTWSDKTSSSHSRTTADWMNDNLLKDSLSQVLN